jgi:hypothetical protein
MLKDKSFGLSVFHLHQSARGIGRDEELKDVMALAHEYKTIDLAHVVLDRVALHTAVIEPVGFR